MAEDIIRKQISIQYPIRISGILVTIMGCVVLLGWALGFPYLSSLGPDNIPMAPSTALFFAFYGFTVLIFNRLLNQQGAYRTVVAVYAAVTFASLVLMILSYNQIYLDAERLGIAIVDTDTAGRVPIGHMSPLTALCFLIAGLWFFVSFSSSSVYFWRIPARFILAILLILISLVFLLAYILGTPFLYGGSIIPPSITTCGTFVALGIGVFLLVLQNARPLSEQSVILNHSLYILILVFFVMAAGIVTSGHSYYKSYVRNYRKGIEQQISAIADLKMKQIQQWRSERINDASVIFKNSAFTKLVKNCFENPDDADAQALIEAWILRVKESYDYNRICLLDTQLKIRMSIPDGAPHFDSNTLQFASEAMRSGQVTFVDFYRNEYDQRVYLNIIVPIIDLQDNNRVYGALAMHIDPELFFYPLVNIWPTPSPTAETMLIRRDGNDALFLNELRFKKNTALTLRIPLTKTSMPAVKAILGQKGIIEGIDYRGVPVIADVHPINDSPWFMIARMDISEVYAPLQEHIWMIIIVIGTLVLCTGAGIGLIWREQKARFYKEKYKASEALQESEKRFRTLYENAPILIDGFDKNGRCILWNRECEKTFGWTISEINSHEEPLKLFYPDPDILKEVIDTVTSKPDKIFREWFPLTKDGKELTVLWANFQLSDGMVINIGLDITERKRTEAELLRLAKVVEQTDEAIILADKDGIIYYVNPSFERITGYSKEEATGQKPSLLKSGKQDPTFYKELWETISGGKVWKGHFINRKKDGTLYDEEATISPIKTGGGIINYVAVKRDVTKELKLEEQLQQAQKMEAIGVFAGGIAHDFNNILGGILGFTQIAQGELPKESPAQYYLAETIKLGDRAANLVKQILSFSRKTAINRFPMQLSPLIKEALRLIRASLPKTIEIRQKIMDQGSMVEADPTQIHQVLMNLCANAAHAMEEKGGVLEVDLSRITVSREDIVSGQDIEPGPYVRLRISDTGTGIDPAIINRIFDPFFTTKSVGKGTGLGLSVVYGIIKRQGGDITVLSNPGRGTTFSILLPEVSPSAEIKHKKNDAALLSGNESILFVDDEEALAGLAKKMLEPLGYNVTAVQSSQEALEIFKNKPDMFDLVITDLTMPHMTGYELSQELFRLRPEMPVILCTGYNDTNLDGANLAGREREQCIKAVLIKPVNRKLLAETIRKVLNA